MMISHVVSVHRIHGIFAIAAGLFLPSLAMAQAGDLIVAEFADESVLQFDSTTGNPIGYFVEPETGGIQNPQGLLFDGMGHLLVTGESSDSVVSYDAMTGELVEVLVESGSGGLRSPYEVLMAPGGTSFIVASYGTDSVLEYDLATGDFLGEFVTAGDGGLFGPNGMVFGPNGMLYVASDDGAIHRYDGDTGDYVDTFVPSETGDMFFAAFDLEWGEDANLYVSYPWDDRVLYFDGSTGDYLGDFVSTGSGGLAFPTGMLWDRDGNLLVASDAGVLRYDGGTGDFMDEFVPAGSGGFTFPGYIAYIPGGDAGFGLSVDGTCPGQLTLSTTGGTPSRAVAFLYAFGEGSLIIPGGPCAGTQLGLNATVRLAATVRADENGDASMVGNAPAGACGRVFLQAVDVATCETSNVIGI